MPKYGLISKVDASVIEKTLDFIISKFPEEDIYTTCVGIFDGDTDRGIHEYLLQKGVFNYHTAIDNEKDKPVLNPHQDCKLIIGNSNEVYNQLDDESQHFIFIDGNHSLPSVIADFFCYASKVKIGGFLLFHDTGRHIKPMKDYQRMGSLEDPDMYISVRRALARIGLFEDAGYDLFPSGEVSDRYLGGHGFRLIFDEADQNDEAGGVCVFMKKK